MNTQPRITLPAGAIYWIHQKSGVSQTYIKEFMKAPLSFQGSNTIKAKIIDAIEDYKKHEHELAKLNERKLNALLSSSHE